MANYVCTVRTNYFHVTDSETFKALMEKVQGDDDIKLWEEKDSDGNPVFGFGCDDSISGIPELNEDGEEEITDDSYDNFLSELQNVVAENDAIIILESGHEDMSNVNGFADIVTSKQISYINLKKLAVDKAREMLGNPEYSTQTEN